MTTETHRNETAARITEILLDGTDPALDGLTATASGITIEPRWPNTIGIRYHATSRNGTEVTIDVEVEADGTSSWRYATADGWQDMPKPHAAAALEAATAGAKADAEWLSFQNEPGTYELDETGKALAVILTDPRLRAGLDPKALEQARRAVGLVDETGHDETRPRLSDAWSFVNNPPLNEADDEALLDRRVQARLATDPAYRNAENADEQADREHDIEQEEIDRLNTERLQQAERAWEANTEATNR